MPLKIDRSCEWVVIMGHGERGSMRTAGPKTSHVHNLRGAHVFVPTAAKPSPPLYRQEVTQEVIEIAKSLPPALLVNALFGTGRQ